MRMPDVFKSGEMNNHTTQDSSQNRQCGSQYQFHAAAPERDQSYISRIVVENRDYTQYKKAPTFANFTWQD